MSRITKVFKSHQRIVNGHIVSHNSVPRQAIFEINNEMLCVGIVPVLSPKIAHFVRQESNLYVEKYYKGEDPDYRFVLYYSPDGQIEMLSVFRDDIGIEYKYFSEDYSLLSGLSEKELNLLLNGDDY